MGDEDYARSKDFIEKQISIFMATANKECQPYIQHRGGPPGFLRVIDETTLGFADYIGNQQYITSEPDRKRVE